MISKAVLLDVLPPFENNQVIIEKKQNVHDIIKEVLNAHKCFAVDYDFIYGYFDQGTTFQICKNLFDFCKQNIRYEIEPEASQTTKSPAAILALGFGDCKHYAGFIGGVLSAINRNDEKNIDWCYTFASYSLLDPEVQHVFITVRVGQKEIWIDPVLCCFDTRSNIPVTRIDKKVNDFIMLTRVSGIGVAEPAIDPVTLETVSLTAEDFADPDNFANAVTTTVNLPSDLADVDFQADPATIEDIKMLLYYGIIDTNSNLYPDIYINTLDSLSGQDAIDLQNAYVDFYGKANTIGDLFGSIWNSVKQVGLAPARGAYLGLMSLNIFGLADQMYALCFNPDGTKDNTSVNKIEPIWHGKLMGDTNLLLRAAQNGHKKPKIFGVEDCDGVGDTVLDLSGADTTTVSPVAPVAAAATTTTTTLPTTTASAVSKGCAALAAAGALINPTIGVWVGAACAVIGSASIIISALAAKAATGIPIDPGLISTTPPPTPLAQSLSNMLPVILIGGILLIYMKK